MKATTEAITAAQKFSTQVQAPATTYVEALAVALQSFADAARADEKESIRGWMGVNASDALVAEFDRDERRREARDAAPDLDRNRIPGESRDVWSER